MRKGSEYKPDLPYNSGKSSPNYLQVRENQIVLMSGSKEISVFVNSDLQEKKFTRFFSPAACKRKNSREFFYLQLARRKIHSNFFICSLQEEKFTRIFLFAACKKKNSLEFFHLQLA
ncbi:MAG: hypothetical protein LBC40_04810 [Dysgonamonadaceae bacterium]|nr:hypothetical protein [Dysgonamonadaceae bacterium]